jgi:rod shape-determining protein MreD
MTPLVSALGATAAALLELSVLPHLAVGGARLHLVLVLGVVWTAAAGVQAGLVWAFVGGLALDVLAQRPVGSSAFALLVSVGGAALLAPLFSRIRPVSPVPLVFALSYVNSLLLLGVYGALRTPILDPEPLRTLLPGVLYDTAVAALVGPVFILLRDRRVNDSSPQR